MPPELYTVAEIATFSKLTLRANEHEFVDYLDTGNLTEGLIQSLEHYSDLSKLPSRAKKIVIEGDILFSTVRPNNRHYGIIHGNSKNLVVSTGFSVIRANRNIVLPEYLYYHLTSNSTVELLQSIAEQSVSAYPSINDSDIGKLEFKIPDIQIQKAVIKIIESINQKLSINQEINANLLASLRTVIDNQFAYLPEDMPEGWTSVRLPDLASIVSGYSYKGDELVEDSGDALVTIKNFDRAGGFKIDGYKPLNVSERVKAAQFVDLFDILVAHTDLTQGAEIIGNSEIILSKGKYNKLVVSMDLVKIA